MSIIVNKIKTPDGTILVSRHRHDYNTYLDANGYMYMVDGGLDYLRRNAPTIPAIELSILSTDSHEKIRTEFEWGSRGKSGRDELRYIPLCDLEVDHIKAILATQDHLRDYIKAMFANELEYRFKLNP